MGQIKSTQRKAKKILKTKASDPLLRSRLPCLGIGHLLYQEYGVKPLNRLYASLLNGAEWQPRSSPIGHRKMPGLELLAEAIEILAGSLNF